MDIFRQKKEKEEIQKEIEKIKELEHCFGKIIMMRNKYIFGYEQSMVQLLEATRSFEKCAKFIEPYLKPNMKILDCGCGPGTITTGIAQKVPQGQVTAIDISEGQLHIAKRTTEREGIKNVVYKQADILNLPFRNDFFDLVYANALITQIEDKKRAISELYRVTKPEGIIAARDIDFGTLILYPDNPLLYESHNYRIQSMLEKGTDVLTGRKLKYLFINGGLNTVNVGISTELFSESGDMSLICNYIATELSETSYSAENLKLGKITKEKIIQYQNAWKNFAKDPAAFFMVCWIDVLGIKTSLT